MLQGQRDLVTVGQLLLSELAPLVNAQQGTVYQMVGDVGDSRAGAVAAGRLRHRRRPAEAHRGRQGLVGQCALEKQRILLTKVPRNYTQRPFEPRRARPKNIVVLPVLFEGETKAVIELSSLAAVHADAPDVPRAADPVDRRRAQHDRSDDADREPAAAVAAADDRAADAADRAAADQRGAGARRPSSSPNRTSKSSARTRKSSRRAARSRRRRPSWR